MFWLYGGHLVYNLTSFLSILITFPSFLHNVSAMTWTTTSFNCKYPLMCVHTSHWSYRYPPFMLCPYQRTHKNPWCNLRHFCCHCMKCWLPCGKRTITCVSFNCIQLLSCCVNIVFTKDGICTIVDVAIVNGFTSPILCNSKICCFGCCSSQKMGYCDQHPTNQCLPLAIEIFECLHK